MYRTPYFQYEHDDEIMSLFTSVISISSDGIYVCDRAGHALLFNESLLTISKIPVDALRDYTVDELVEKDIIPISSAGKTLKTGRQESTVIDYYGGSKAILTSTPVYNKSGEILCIISNVRDITKLNQLEKELSELSHKQSAMNEQQFFQRGGLIYSSKEMEETLELASAFAPNDAPIMILGETGVGKDILAQYIHERSERTGQFVKVNCGAIPEHLLESELFGYVKGAFSGATSDKVGLVELANDGTLFLDEVGDMPHPQQVKLLHVLQDQMVRRIGHTKTTPVNIRVISATNADMDTLIAAKKFRSDLFYRLNVLSITIPPLRERIADVSTLLFFFLKQLEKRYSLVKRMDSSTIQALLHYAWPGNVRELKSMIERMYHMCQSQTISKDLLPDGMTGATGEKLDISLFKENNEPPSLKQAIAQFEQTYIADTLAKARTLKEAAEQLDIDISTLVRKKKRLNITSQ